MDAIGSPQHVLSRLTRRSGGFLSALLIVVNTGCGLSAGTTTTTSAATSTTVATTTTPPLVTTSSIEAPSLDVQASIDWFVSIVNGEQLTESEYESRFTDQFRREVPFDEGFSPVLDEFRPQGPFTVVERSTGGRNGEAVIEASDGTRLRVLAEIEESGRLSTLLIQPADAPSLDDPPETVEEAFSRLADMGTLRAITAEVVDGECVSIHHVNVGQPAPLGSVFKLYVLAALGEAVAKGQVAWDDEVEIRDDLKSVPAGVLQDRSAGETVPVLEAAELMISISDNTATDHLVDLLGRETVESALPAYGNTTPGLNRPLLDTREFTALKVGPASGLSTQWLQGDEKARRQILAQISDITPGDLPVQEWVEPIQPDELEWFATPEDLCTLAVELSELAGSVPEVADILAINPGIPADGGTWDRLWFKGGSEPGLLAAWFVTESDGRTFVTAGSVVDPDSVIDTEEAVLLFAAARDLLAP